jgi:hypothetical protein
MCLTVAAVATAGAFTFENTGGSTFGSESSTAGAGTGVSFFSLVTEPGPGTIPGAQYTTIGWGNQPGASFTTGTDPFTQTGPPDSAARSALRIDTFSGIIDPGDTVTIATLTHANRKIFIPFLKTVTIDTRLRIKDGATIANESFDATGISLTETPNLASAAACDPDTQIPLTAPCSDFFLFPLGTFAPIAFRYLGNDYTLTFGLDPGLGTIFEPVDCSDPSGPPVPDGECGRIRTAEVATNTIDITAHLELISRPPVPAPASLIILGVALLGVGVADRFRKSKGWA